MISMIDPHHVCSWTGRRLTEIKVTGVAATGAGVSLHVLLHAFGGQELVWFSRVYGDHDDNFLLLAVDRAAAGSLQRLPPHRPMPETVASDNPDVEEFELSEAVAARLEVRIEHAGCSIGQCDLIRKEISIHDDCFFSVEPLDDALLKQLLHVILRQHSFYLGVPVDWTGVLDPIGQTLTQTGSLRLQSNPRRQNLTVSWEPAGTSLFGNLWGRRPSHVVRIDHGQASLVGG